MPNDLQVDWKPMIQEWKTLEHGEAGDWFGQLRRRFFPEKTVEAVRAHFYREKRKRLGKSKESPKEMDPRKLELCRIIVEMKERGKQRADAEREMPTPVCLNRLIRRGVMEAGEMSQSHANTIIREQLAYREETPRVRWEVDRALAEVQTDGSVSKYFRPFKLSDDGQDMLLKASGRPLRYKGRDANHTKLILWQYQDKYSRLRVVRGIPGKAESTLIALGTMKWWLNRPKDGHVMRHIPWSFGHDNGSLFRTQEWEQMLRAFELDPDNNEDNRSSIPYEKTGIGSVERSWQPIWTLEMELSEDYPQMWLSEYNMLMHEAMIAEQKKRHPYFSGYRGDLYQQSLLKQKPRPRVLEQDVFSLASKQYERKVSSERNISIDGVKYRVPQHYESYTTDGEWVMAWKNWRGNLVAVLRDHYCNQPFELVPDAHQMKGEYKGFKRTYQQQVKDMISSGASFYEAVMNGQMSINDEGEYVDERTGEIVQPQSAQPQRLMPKDEALQPYSPFAGNPPGPLHQGGETPDQFASVFKAKAWIGKQLQGYGVTYADVAKHFDSIIEDGLDKDVIAGAVQELANEINRKAKAG